MEISSSIKGHGTRNMYNHYGCRCTNCKRANAEYQANANKRRYAALAQNREVIHGLNGTYSNHGCRCDRCKAAWKDLCFDQTTKRLQRKACVEIRQDRS